jgi:hypothetical protein
MEVRVAYHVAFLVKDLQTAIPDMEKALHLHFRKPEPLNRAELDAGSTDAPVMSSYSLEGPPYVQLIEAQPSGVYGIQQGEGLHHFGVWVDDAEESRQVLEGAGIRSDKVIQREDHTVAWYSRPEDLHGIRIEYTGETLRPGVESWLQGLTSYADVRPAQN